MARFRSDSERSNANGGGAAERNRSGLSIEPVSIDDVVDATARELAADEEALLRAASNAPALSREVDRQIGDPDGS